MVCVWKWGSWGKLLAFFFYFWISLFFYDAIISASSAVLDSAIGIGSAALPPAVVSEEVIVYQ